MAELGGKNILLGVSGGIAAYKAVDLCRRLTEVGANVQVVMTESAQHFVGATSFQAVSGRAVRSSLWDASAEAAMSHIELARWPDLILIAPASANTLARICHGMADDLLSTLVLASDRPLAVAPAMNRLMWANPATQDNLAVLLRRGVKLLGPASGAQACGEIGAGRMLEPLDIRREVISLLTSDGLLRGRRVVITAGPTREAIDPVRFISNRSSGKQGYALAAALRQLGADVCLLSGPTALPVPVGVTRIAIETAAELLEAARAAVVGADLFIAAAAVADYRPQAVAAGKIKKHEASLSLQLERTTDVLATIRAENPALFVVGFAAETSELAAHALDKMQRKQLDMIAANWVGDGRAFDQDHNALEVFWPGGGHVELSSASKTDIAQALATLIAQRYLARP